MANSQIDKKKLKDFKENIHHLPENFSQFHEKNPDNKVAQTIKFYHAEQLQAVNFLEESPHDHGNNTKTAINAEILLAIYNANKDNTNDNKVHSSWKNCHKDVVKDSQKFKKRAAKSFLHFVHEGTCALVCFGLEGIFLVPIAVLIEVEGDWKFLDLLEEIKNVYQERPKESWAILILFVILTIILIKLSHHYIPNKLFSEESERKNCLMILEKNIIHENAPSALEDILNVYYNCAINDKDASTIDLTKINNLELHTKPILEAYEILNNALWATNDKNLFITDVAQISQQKAI